MVETMSSIGAAITVGVPKLTWRWFDHLGAKLACYYTRMEHHATEVGQEVAISYVCRSP